MATAQHRRGPPKNTPGRGADTLKHLTRFGALIGSRGAVQEDMRNVLSGSIPNAVWVTLAYGGNDLASGVEDTSRVQPLLRTQRTSGKDLPSSPFPGRKGITKEGVYGHKGGGLAFKGFGRFPLEQGYGSLVVQGHGDTKQILSIVLGLNFVLSASVLQDLHEP